MKRTHEIKDYLIKKKPSEESAVQILPELIPTSSTPGQSQQCTQGPSSVGQDQDQFSQVQTGTQGPPGEIGTIRKEKFDL